MKDKLALHSDQTVRAASVPLFIWRWRVAFDAHDIMQNIVARRDETRTAKEVMDGVDGAATAESQLALNGKDVS